VKIWIKILVGSIIGIALGALLPASTGIQDIFGYLAKLFLQVGRYVVFPLAFFSLMMGTHELRRERSLPPVYGRLLLYLVGSTVLLVLVGMLTFLVFAPERIPIIVEEQRALELPGLRQTLLALFPENLFQALVGPGSLLLPLLFLAFLLGINLNYDLRVTSPVIQLADSLSRIFYHINSLLCELFGFAMVVLSAYFLMSLRQGELALFKQMLIILGIDTALIVFAVYPALLYFLGERGNPYKWLYALLAPVLVAFFTGDNYLGVSMLSKHGRENLGVPRRVGATVYPLFAVFGRAGSAMVASATFLLVLKSYSSLEISLLQFLWTLLFSVIVSLALGSVPGLGAYVALSALCAAYGKGLQEGYLILRPLSVLMVSFGALLDVLTSGFVSWLIARKQKLGDTVEIYDFV
jgi:aerobic C4-dicarboxylate transport protein